MVSESEADGKKVLKVEGPLTIHMAPGLRAALAGAVEADGRVVLDLSEAEEVDLACLQLVYSALLTAEGMVATLTVRDRASGAFAQAAEAAGLTPYMGKYLELSE